LLAYDRHRFLLDEGVLHKGAALHAAWASQYLLKHATDSSEPGETRQGVQHNEL
jgi:hypothetical protein